MKKSVKRYNKTPVILRHEGSLLGRKKTMERSFVPLDDFFYLIFIEVFHIKILVQVKYTISRSDADERKHF